MKITDFVGLMTTGFARSNRYTLDMSLPAMMQVNRHTSEIQKMLVLCDSIQLPGLNLNTAQIRTFGEIREIPYEFNYEPIQISFYVDGDMMVKNIFDDWIKSIQQGTNRTFNYYDNYICPEMKIYVQDLEDNDIFRVSVFEAYPKSVNAVQMGYDQKDIMKVSVSMNYKYWESTNVLTVEQPPVVAPVPSRGIPERQSVITNLPPDSNNIGNPMGDVSGFGGGW